jgi:hypothetical protein
LKNGWPGALLPAVRDRLNSEIRRVLNDARRLPLDASALDEPEKLYAANMSSYGSVDVTRAVEDTFQIEFPA